MTQVLQPFAQFFDTDGSPLDAGYIYIGSVNQNPETNPISVYWDESFTIPAAQPIRTLNGYVVRNGTPARIYINSDDFSITVKNSKNRIVASLLDANSLSNLQTLLAASSGSSLVGFIQSATGAAPRTLQAKEREIVSITDFYANGVSGALVDPTETTLSTAGIQAALDSVKVDVAPFDIQTDSRGGAIFIPAGRYRVGATLNGKAGTKLYGEGMNVSILVSELATGNVLSFLGIDAGSVDLVQLEDFAVVQKFGVAHAAGYAISIDGNSFGTTPRIKNVFTQDTYAGFYFDWCFPGVIDGCLSFRHAGDGFTTRANCTSTTFRNCYAGANTGKGYKIAGQYMTLIGCASDSNTGRGYDFYFDGGSSAGLSVIGCGAEINGAEGMAFDRCSGVSIISPRIISTATSGSPIKLDGGDVYTIIQPVLSASAASASYAINISNASGAYPNGVQLDISTTTTNLAGVTNQLDYIMWFGSRSAFGADGTSFRIGPISSYNSAIQSLFIGANFRTGSGGTVYSLNSVPTATTGYAGEVSTWRSKPVVNAPAGTIAIFRSGFSIEAPTVTAGTVTRHEGGRIADQPAGGSADANLVLGDATVAVGRWSLYNGSTRSNYQGGATQFGQIAAASAPNGSMFVDVADGVLKFKDSGGVSHALY